MKKITAKKMVLSVIGFIGLSLIIVFAVDLSKTIQNEKEYRKYCDAPTETVKIDGITTDYQKIDNYRFYEYDLIYCNFGVGQLAQKVKGANLYTVSENQDVLVNLDAYTGLETQSKIYVKSDKYKLLPAALSDEYVSYISLGFSKNVEEGFGHKQLILNLTQDDIKKAISFCKNEDNLLKKTAETEKVEIAEGNVYSICCHIKGLEELFFYYPYLCVQNLNNGKYFLRSSVSIDVIYEIPDEYQDIIKSAVNMDE